MRTLDLTVVADRACPASRAYLSYMRHAGYRPRKVLLVAFGAPRAPEGRLQKLLGVRWGSRAQRYLRRAAPPPDDALFEEACEAMQDGQPLRIDYFGAFDYAAHAEELAACRAAGYSDPAFQARLRAESGALLYTCGDRVPAQIADDPKLRILHIHPGIVPAIRGSDGLLWSLAVRGRPGASCFYMDSGIDTGAVIERVEFDAPRFPGLAKWLPGHEAALYRALLHSYDPHLRGQTLVRVLRRHEGRSLRELPATPQPPGEGRWWFAMHPLLRRKVLAERVLC